MSKCSGNVKNGSRGRDVEHSPGIKVRLIHDLDPASSTEEEDVVLGESSRDGCCRGEAGSHED